MEELEILKKRTKILKIIFITLLLIIIALLIDIKIKESQIPTGGSAIKYSNDDVNVFNSRITQYIGRHLSSSETKALIITVNAINNDETVEHKIELEGITSTTEILDNNYYTTDCNYSNSGHINKIIIKMENK